VYIPKHAVVQYVTGNDTSALLNTSESIATDVDLVRNIQYRSGTNTLGIIFFCLIFGTVLGSMGRKAYVVVQFFAIVEEVMMRMVSRVMW
jgi:Na+/H+-dicarboxylate symporter